jgi:hypothetical protein
VHGRLIILVLLIIALVVGGSYYTEHKNDNPKKELIRLLNSFE